MLAGCELHEVPAAGGRRHHYFTAILRDLIGNLWACADEHADQDEAQACARTEYDRRLAAGLLSGQARRPVAP